MTDCFDLTGKVGLITGASQGLGAGFASTLARAGAKVALAARQCDKLADLQRTIEAAGGTARAVSMDVTDTVSVWWQFFLPRYMASDQLLSLVVIMSGTIGAVIAAIRAKRVLSPTDIGFGVAAGFITLLAIRGGKNVLVVSNEDVSFYINPYSSAFFGLLAGLFTDRAY